MASATQFAAKGSHASHPALLDVDVLRVGTATFRLTGIIDYEFEERIERDWVGPWLCAIGYGIVATLIFAGLLLGLDWKFSIAAVFLAGIAVMSLSDATAVSPVTTYWLHVALRDGRQASFVDADMAVVEEIARRIDRARGQ